MGLPAHIAALFLTFKVLCTDFHIDYPDLNTCQEYVAVYKGSLPPRTTFASPWPQYPTEAN